MPEEEKVAKSQRNTKTYAFKPEDFRKDFPPKAKANAKADANTVAEDVRKLAMHLGRWMRDMKAWGEDVRDDIVRLETAARVAPGDPGDPPPAPRAK